MPNLPRIDPSIEHVGVSALRVLSGHTLRDLTKILVIVHNGQPVSVLFPYDRYMKMQAELDRLVRELEGENA